MAIDCSIKLSLINFHHYDFAFCFANRLTQSSLNRITHLIIGTAVVFVCPPFLKSIVELLRLEEGVTHPFPPFIFWFLGQVVSTGSLTYISAKRLCKRFLFRANNIGQIP